MSGQQSGPPQGGQWQQPGQGRPGAPGSGQPPQAWGQPGGWGPQQSAPQGWSAPPAPRRRSTGRGGKLPTIAIVSTLVSALVALVYGGYAIIGRRGIFADLADDAPVTVDDASRSDTLNGLLLAITLVVVLVTLVLWVVTLVVARRGRNALGLGGLALVGVGAICALVGGFLSSGVENVDDAGTAATGYVLVGVGFVLMALGNLVGAAGLRQAAPADTSAGDDRRGGSGFGDGRPQQAAGWGSQGQPTYQPGQSSGWAQPQPGRSPNPGQPWGQQPPGQGGPRPPQGGWGQQPPGQQGGPGGWGPPAR